MMIPELTNRSPVRGASRRSPSRRRPSRRSHVLLAVVGILLAGCGEAELTGREWVNAGKATERRLGPTDDVAGMVYADQRIHPVVRQNYGVFVERVAWIYKKTELFNRTATPFRVYLMWDASDYARYGGGHLDDLGAYVPQEAAIYLHCNGAELADRGQNRRLIRELARAVVDDMYQREYPKWFAEGLVRYYADGAFGDKVWHRGLPDADAFRPLLPGAGVPAPSFTVVSRASDAEFAALGPAAIAVAHAAIYLLRELDKDQFQKVVWQFQLRGLESAADLAQLMAECVPRFKQLFADPLQTLTDLRPDLREYLECGLVPPSPAVAARCRKNAETYQEEGIYWYQLGRVLEQTGDAAAALLAFDRSRKLKPHRFVGRCLEALSTAALAEGDAGRLGDLGVQALRTSVQPTPRMHRVLAESLYKTQREQALQHVTLGLELPPAGFEADVARLQELRVALAK